MISSFPVLKQQTNRSLSLHQANLLRRLKQLEVQLNQPFLRSIHMSISSCSDTGRKGSELSMIGA